MAFLPTWKGEVGVRVPHFLRRVGGGDKLVSRMGFDSHAKGRIKV